MILILRMAKAKRKKRTKAVSTNFVSKTANIILHHGHAGGPSLYNDGKGIKMTLLFTPLLAPPEAGKKRRANAKPPVMTRIEYFHEDVPLRDFLIKTLTSIKRRDLFESSWLFQGRELDGNDCFIFSYTIPRRVTDQVIISDEKDYKQMVVEALSKSPFELKVYIVEKKVCHFKYLLFSSF